MRPTSTALVVGALAFSTTLGACALPTPASCPAGVCAPADDLSAEDVASFASAFADPLASSSARSAYELDFGEVDPVDAGPGWTAGSLPDAGQAAKAVSLIEL